MKMKWKVSPKPTGRYRSFEIRGWPYLVYEDGQLAASIHCADAYSKQRAESMKHAPLSVIVYDYSSGPQLRRSRRLAATFNTLNQAKCAALAALLRFPGFVPTPSGR